MGLNAILKPAFSFLYEAQLDQGLTEHEIDHVVFGYTNDKPNINPDEVAAYKWITIDQLTQELEKNRASFTVWFQILLDQHLEKIIKAANESM